MEKEIVEYKILSDGNHREELEQKVRQAIADGWQPFGDLKIINGWFFQAMVKYKKQ